MDQLPSVCRDTPTNLHTLTTLLHPKRLCLPAKILLLAIFSLKLADKKATGALHSLGPTQCSRFVFFWQLPEDKTQLRDFILLFTLTHFLPVGPQLKVSASFISNGVAQLHYAQTFLLASFLLHSAGPQSICSRVTSHQPIRASRDAGCDVTLGMKYFRGIFWASFFFFFPIL